MRRKMLGLFRPPSAKNNGGFIMTVVVLIVAAIVSVIIIKVALSTLSHLNNADQSLKGEAAKYQTQGCLQEALIRLKRDPSHYVGGVINLGDGSCDITVVGEGDSRALIVVGSLNGYQQNLAVNLTIDPFAVTTWDN
ncbi:MAG: hypothetical protein WC480_03705 [Patescibacteria group bacterium]